MQNAQIARDAYFRSEGESSAKYSLPNFDVDSP